MHDAPHDPHPEHAHLAPVLAGIVDGARVFCGPETIELHVMSGCDNTCLACWNHSPRLEQRPRNAHERRPPLPLETVERVLDDFQAMAGRKVLLSGAGEPLLHPRFLDLLRAIKSRGLECELVTAGAPLDDALCEALLELRLDAIVLSLWAGSAQSYAAAHPNRPAERFHRITRALRRLKAGRDGRGEGAPRVTLFQLLFNKTAADLTEMLTIGARLGVDQVAIAPADLMPGVTDDLALSERELRQALAALDAAPLRDDHDGFPWVFALDEGFVRTAGGLSCPAGLPGEWIEGLFAPAARFDTRWCGDCGRQGDCPAATGAYHPRACRVQGLAQLRAHLDGAPARDYRAIIDATPCTVGWSYTRVGIDGRVIPCCKGQAQVMGDVTQDGLASIWHGERYREFRQRARDLPKDHPYFAPIACYQGCDNLTLNQETWRRLSEAGVKALKTAAP